MKWPAKVLPAVTYRFAWFPQLTEEGTWVWLERCWGRDYECWGTCRTWYLTRKRAEQGTLGLDL